MIGFADLGILAFFKQVVFVNKPWLKGIVWAKPEVARQALAGTQGQANVGTPGIAVYRTALVDNPEQPSLARASMGIPQGLLVGHPGAKRNRLRWIAQVATYTVTACTESQSDMNSIERLLVHCPTYKTIDYTIKDAVDTPMATRFPIFAGQRAYGEILDKNTPQVLERMMQMQFFVEVPLILNVEVPVIESIQVAYEAYKRATNGEMVLDTVFDVLKMNYEGQVSRIGPT